MRRLRARLLPMNRLRLVAPTNVLDAVSRVTMGLNATALYTTEPSPNRLPGRRPPRMGTRAAATGGSEQRVRSGPSTLPRGTAKALRGLAGAIGLFARKGPAAKAYLVACG